MNGNFFQSADCNVVRLLIVSLTSLSLHAGVVPGRWEKVEKTVERGEVVTVELKSGDRSPWRFWRLTPQAVVFDNGLGGFFKIERNRIASISRERCRGDDLAQMRAFAVLIPLVVGGVVGHNASRTAGIATGAALGGFLTYGVIYCTREELLYVARPSAAAP